MTQLPASGADPDQASGNHLGHGNVAADTRDSHNRSFFAQFSSAQAQAKHAFQPIQFRQLQALSMSQSFPSQSDPDQDLTQAAAPSDVSADQPNSNPSPTPIVSMAAGEGTEASSTQSVSSSYMAKARLAQTRKTQPRLSRQQEQQGSLASRQQRRAPQLKAKITAWALAVSMIPVLAVGTGTYFSSQSIHRQLSQAKQTGNPGIAATALNIQRQLPPLLIGTGLTAALAGGIAAFLANRAMRPVLKAVTVSHHLVNRLRREEETAANVATQADLVSLETNLNIIGGQLPDLLSKQETEAERFQVLQQVVHRLRACLSEEDVFRTAVDQTRKILNADRVSIFSFDPKWDGTFVEESVAAGWPKLLWSTVHDPCFGGGYADQYRDGRVRAIDNIYEAGISDCHIGLLERFGVKANLVAPILNDNQLFGLLIAHQCAGPRLWQQSDIDLTTQIAMQVGLALDNARLIQQINTRVEQAQILETITRHVRASLYEEDVLSTTVEEVRKALRADRVMIYAFDPEWYGSVVAESVLPGFPKALWAEIQDPCFAQGFVEQYRAGRVHAIDDVCTAAIGKCYLDQLEQFAVKANAVAPILKDDQLFGLLIAHQCSSPRSWQQTEIDLLTQIAVQVGFALDHARLLAQVDEDYQTAHGTSTLQLHQKEAMQQQVIEFLRERETTVRALSAETMNQMELVTALYDQVKVMADFTQSLLGQVQQGTLQGQQVDQTVQAGYQAVEQVQDCMTGLEETVIKTATKIQDLEQPARKLDQVLTQLADLVAQLKLQAMNATLEAARIGDAGQGFAHIGEKVHSLVRRLDTDIAGLKPLVVTLTTETRAASDTMAIGQQQVSTGAQWVAEAQEKLYQIATYTDQMSTLAEQVTQTATKQVQQSDDTSQAVIKVANLASQTSEKSAAVVETFERLAGMVQEG